jgi:hypothetical protein
MESYLKSKAYNNMRLMWVMFSNNGTVVGLDCTVRSFVDPYRFHLQGEDVLLLFRILNYTHHGVLALCWKKFFKYGIFYFRPQKE